MCENSQGEVAAWLEEHIKFDVVEAGGAEQIFGLIRFSWKYANGVSADCKILSGNPGVWPICHKILYASGPDPVIFCIGSSGAFFTVP